MMRWSLPRPRHATVVAYLALFVAGTGTAAAATGGTFLLGKSNSATSVTGLTNSKGTALSLSAKSGSAPLTVNSTTKVSRLNADLLDGLTSSQLQRRTEKTCSTAVKSIAASGTVECTVAPKIKTTVVTGYIDNLAGSATCPAGSTLLSGGFDLPFATEANRDYVRKSGPTQSYIGGPYDTWTVTLDPPTNDYQVNPQSKVYAVCGSVA